VKDRHVATTRNISLGGVFVETTTPLPLQTRLQIRFRIPTQSEPIEVGGEVRWVEPGEWSSFPGMGIRFQGLRAREVWALNRFLPRPDACKLSASPRAEAASSAGGGNPELVRGAGHGDVEHAACDVGVRI